MIYVNYNAKTGEFKTKDKTAQMVSGTIKGYGKHTSKEYETEYFDLYLENEKGVKQVSFTINWTTFWLFNGLLNTDHNSEITINSYSQDKKFWNLGMEYKGEKLRGKYEYQTLNMPDHKYEKMDKMKEYSHKWINELIQAKPYNLSEIVKQVTEVHDEIPF